LKKITVNWFCQSTLATYKPFVFFKRGSFLLS